MDGTTLTKSIHLLCLCPPILGIMRSMAALTFRSCSVYVSCSVKVRFITIIIAKSLLLVPDMRLRWLYVCRLWSHFIFYHFPTGYKDILSFVFSKWQAKWGKPVPVALLFHCQAILCAFSRSLSQTTMVISSAKPTIFASSDIRRRRIPSYVLLHCNGSSTGPCGIPQLIL